MTKLQIGNWQAQAILRLFGIVHQCVGTMGILISQNGELPGLGLEEFALESNDIADIPFFELAVLLVADNLFFDIDLDPAGLVLDM